MKWHMHETSRETAIKDQSIGRQAAKKKKIQDDTRTLDKRETPS